MPSGSIISQTTSNAQNRLTSISSHLRTSKPKIVVCRDLGPDVMPLLTKRDDIEPQVVLWAEDRVCERTWLLENIKGAAGIVIVFSELVDAELLDAAGPSLKVVSTMSVGYEHIRVPELAKRNVRIGYTPEVLTDAVADISVMLALMAGRNANETMSIVREGQHLTAPLPHAPVGFLGFGRISHATLARLIPFGVTDCIYSSNPSSSSSSKKERDEALLKQHQPQLKSLRAVDIDTLARESDVLFVLAPGGPSTRHLVNEEFLRKMKKHSVLVNAGRGTVVDSDALAKALRERWIWGAGVDVVEGEPNVGKDHPLVKEPRCNILPHIGSASFETRLAMATLAVDNCLAGIAGQAMPAELDVKA
ncbi:hypothetical protein BT96DRAFT_947810 [Gymnopus androsaceus JB14]|uniref:Glyoxylate reductase n=1 Tax=Gymnopus androsaceus JB14 TaxID=1447944 RepID=A0A6A4GSP8_9AGAR|nr:hypothetical protein BT96DRAFT_947810 [Gymnopus androsaceus JB14]